MSKKRERQRETEREEKEDGIWCYTNKDKARENV